MWNDVRGVVDSDRFDSVFRTGLGLDEAMDVRTTSYGETQEWDSIAHMQLVAELEREFGIMIETEDVIAMSDYAITRDILRTKYDVPIEP